jgi:hypothetical protein
MGSQTFSGNSSYSGQTKIGQSTGGGLFIDGTTVGQGNYTLGPNSFAALGGTGTIGLAADAKIVANGGRISPGPATPPSGNASRNGIANLRIQASGSGGVVFNNSAELWMEIGSAGASDRFTIDGGTIDLRSLQDTLRITALTGAFDGSTYTLATFSSNLGGVFNNVTGVPADYSLVYSPPASCSFQFRSHLHSSCLEQHSSSGAGAAQLVPDCACRE